MGRMRLAEFMSLPEDDFQKIIQEVENDPLFKKLTLSEIKIIRYKKLPWTKITQPKMLPLDPAITPSRDTLEVESFLAQEKDLVSIIKKLGVDRFKKYFLDGVIGITSTEVARQCGLTLETVKKINDFVDKFYLQSKLTGSSQDNRTTRIYYSTIASIEENDVGLAIGYFSPEMAKGRYLIDFDRIEKIKKVGIFAKDEIRKIDSLLNKLRLINSRKTTIYEVIENLIEVQRDFLLSGDFKDLKAFTQVSLSRKMGVNPSLISRAINGKAIRTPQGRQISLKILFPSEREIRKKLIREVIEQEKKEMQNKSLSKPYSDQEIRIQLRKKYGTSISRRSISDCRKDLKIPSSFERMHQYREFSSWT
jgi:RNA polymerase sigma-54 factor